MTFGQRMYKRREQLGLTQAELSQRTAIAQTRLSEYEGAVRTEMTLSTALRIARALGVGLDYLAGTFDDQADGVPPAAVAPRRRGRPPKAAPAGASSSAR